MPECRAVKFEIFGRLIRTGSKWGVKLPYKRIKRQIVNVFWQKKSQGGRVSGLFLSAFLRKM